MKHALTLLKFNTHKYALTQPSIETQRDIVETFATQQNFEVEHEYVEFERRQEPVSLDNRLKINRALERAKWLKAPIIVSHTDILFYDTNSFNHLMQQQVKFIVVGLDASINPIILTPFVPKANRGNPKLPIARKKAAISLKTTADRYAQSISPMIEQAQALGFTSYRKIAQYLTQNNIKTARGGMWSAKQISNIIKRLNNDLHNYLDDDGRVKLIPRKYSARQTVLNFIIGKFSKEAEYSESQVNEIINQWHSFDDHARVRRELIDANLLNRTRNCQLYWVV